MTDLYKPPHLLLWQVIATLELCDPSLEVSPAFNDCDSYRGSYDHIAFNPCRTNSVANMLAIAKSCIDRTFEGYKGGLYEMSGTSPCVVARYSMCSLDDADRDNLYKVMSAVRKQSQTERNPQEEA